MSLTREQIIETYLINSPKVIAEMLYDTIEGYEKQLEILTKLETILKFSNESNIVVSWMIFPEDISIISLHENNDYLTFIRKFKGDTKDEAISKAYTYIIKGETR